ncbi:S66 peptidase family protein [Pseudofulvibacter geojedonensis]|uniref:LD-carboxypeptidase n=1 Tax=Pseudofulvibacter geojedonensis TaxID=1123758 RepID=A0ABW3I2Z9_9FLAO
MTIQPPALQQGDTVAIIATARKITREELQPAIDLLEQWGLNAVIGRTIGLDNHQFAGTDEERRLDLQQALDDYAVKAIWCARGGYGTVRIIDALDFSIFKKNPKWIIGFSDVTALHSHVHNLGYQSLHSIMPITVEGNTNEALNSFKKSLFCEPLNYNIVTSKHNRIGQTSGELIGGNLSMLYSILGSESAVQTDGKILFIEDLDEYLYHIDRMMMNLKRNNCFKNLKGLIVGGMTKMHDNTIPFGKNAIEIIVDNTKEYDFPICFDFPAGHLKDNRSLIMGKTAHLNVSQEFVTLDFN